MTRPPRLWVVTEVYAPQETATAHILARVAGGLAADGPVSVLTAQPTYERRTERLPGRESLDGVDVHRLWSTRLDKDVLPLRVLNLVTATVSFFVAACLRVRPGDRVLVVTNPPTLPFALAVACRLRRARLLLLVHDVYPEVLVAAGLLGAGSLSARFGVAATRWLYRRADTVVVLGRDMEELVRSKVGGPSGTGTGPTVVVVPNWADLDDVVPETRDGNALLTRLGLADRFVVGLAGNIGPLNGLETLLDAADLLRDDPSVAVLVVGSGGRRNWFEAEVARRGLANVTVVDRVPRAEASGVHAACDVALVSLGPRMLGVSVPSRLYNVLASGRPVVVVADPRSEPALVVAEEGVGWVVTPGDPGALASAVREAAASGDLAAMGVRARRGAEERYSFAAVLDRWRVAAG